MLRIHHLVPEQMFSTDDAQAQGVSAVKALAIANAEGQKIWTITQDNLNQALNNIDLGIDVETEIRNAVNNGHIATAHEYNINFNGWVGSGYLLIDLETGAGAYKIAGGGNGGLLLITIAIIAIFASFVIAALAASSALSIGIAGGFSIFSMRSYINVINDLVRLNEKGKINEKELNGSVKIVSGLTIIGSFIGIRGKIKGDNISVLDQMFVGALNNFFSLALILPHE